MEAIVKKHQQKFSKVRVEMERWDELQTRLISQFSNATSILQRLQVIGDKKYYGTLKGVDGIERALLAKQMESLEIILLSITNTMEEFRAIVLFLEKMVRDSNHQVRGGSHHLSSKQLQQRIGVKPSLSDCLDGLAILQDMHSAEYLLKTSVISALLKIALEPSAADLGALRQLLVDQPNIPRDEVYIKQSCFELIKRFKFDDHGLQNYTLPTNFSPAMVLADEDYFIEQEASGYYAAETGPSATTDLSTDDLSNLPLSEADSDLSYFEKLRRDMGHYCAISYCHPRCGCPSEICGCYGNTLFP